MWRERWRKREDEWKNCSIPATINSTDYNKSQASRKNSTETNTKFQGRPDLCFKNRAMCFGRNAVCLVLFITWWRIQECNLFLLTKKIFLFLLNPHHPPPLHPVSHSNPRSERLGSIVNFWNVRFGPVFHQCSQLTEWLYFCKKRSMQGSEDFLRELFKLVRSEVYLGRVFFFFFFKTEAQI